MEVLPGIFLQDKLWLHVPKLLFFWLFSCFFACWSKNTIKIGFFDDFEMLIFSFFGQKSRVNNLAMVGSITWPFFGQKFAPKDGQVIDPTFFTLFLLKLFFSKISFSLQKEEEFLKNKKTQQKTIKNRWPSY